MTLKTDMTADLTSVFFNDDEFADSAILAGVTTIAVIFDNAFRSIQGVESYGPQALCKATDVMDVIHGNTLEINGIVYYIIGIQPDDDTTLLLLSRDYDQ
jgi:hypothetical protein